MSAGARSGAPIPGTRPLLVDQWGNPLVSDRSRDDRRRPAVRGSYDGAATTRHLAKHWAAADTLGPLAALRPDIRRRLRSRARYEALESNSYAKGIVTTLANDTIGTGPVLQMQPGDRGRDREIERAWNDWSWMIRLPTKLRTMRLAKCVDGETFARLATNPRLSGPVLLDVIPFECDLVADPFVFTSVDPTNADGVFLDGVGNPTRYRILRRHPGDGLGLAQQYDDVPADQVLHLYNVDRPGQRRGVTEIAPALPLFAMLRAFTLAVLTAADFAASLTAVIQTTAGGVEPDVNDDNDFSTVDIERGMATTLPAGWSMQQLMSQQPAATYEMFKAEILNEIARCLNMPSNVARADSSKYNYASGRLDHQTYARALTIERETWACCLLDPLFDTWLREYLAERSGVSPASIDVSRYRRTWFWDEGGHVDPTKEADAQKTRLASRMTTLRDEYAKEGKDWEEQLEQQAREAATLKRLGLTPPDLGPSNQPPAPVPAEESVAP